MSKRDLLKLPDDLDGNMRALLHTAPMPSGAPGSRKAAPPKPKKKQRRRYAKPAATGTYAYESVPVLREGTRPKKRKPPAKKR